ncbi:MAG TPA: hypothetical protein VHN15_01245 [Thermoanaerobaculia bacterium]|nr:hypothetical protein [Thermoanaerobaculia bacterium]
MRKLKKERKILSLSKETLAVIGGSNLYGNQIDPIASSGMSGCEPTLVPTAQ